MLADIKVIELLDQAEKLGQMVKESEDYEAYQLMKENLYKDQEAAEMINRFVGMKNDYEDVQRFGRYHPDYTVIMKKVRGMKRDIDMHDVVAEFRQKETALQEVLDDVSEIMAHSISENIKAPREGIALKDHGSGSGCGCGSGGSCGCAS